MKINYKIVIRAKQNKTKQFRIAINSPKKKNK